MTRKITDVLKHIGGQILDIVGWTLCKLAFKTDCRGPFAWAYRAAAGATATRTTFDATMDCRVKPGNNDLRRQRGSKSDRHALYAARAAQIPVHRALGQCEISSIIGDRRPPPGVVAGMQV